MELFIWTTLKSVKDKNQTYIKYDLGVLTNHNDIWTISDTCNLTRENEHTLIKESSASDWSIVRVNTLIPVNTRIEYDFKVHDGLVSDFFCALSKTLTGSYINGAGLDHFNGTFDTWYHMVIDINSSSAVFSCNNATRSINYDSLEYVSFYYWLSRDISELSFKNLIVTIL